MSIRLSNAIIFLFCLAVGLMALPGQKILAADGLDFIPPIPKVEELQSPTTTPAPRRSTSIAPLAPLPSTTTTSPSTSGTTRSTTPRATTSGITPLNTRSNSYSTSTPTRSTASRSTDGRGIVGTIAAGNLNVRSGPSSDTYEIVTTLSQGTEVTIIGKNRDENWYRIAYPKHHPCYIPVAAVDDVSTTSMARGGAATSVKVSISNLYVRPWKKSTVVGTAKKGEVVTVLGRNDIFYKIAPPVGASAWISANPKYVKTSASDRSLVSANAPRPGIVPSGRKKPVAAAAESKASTSGSSENFSNFLSRLKSNSSRNVPTSSQIRAALAATEKTETESADKEMEEIEKKLAAIREETERKKKLLAASAAVEAPVATAPVTPVAPTVSTVATPTAGGWDLSSGLSGDESEESVELVDDSVSALKPMTITAPAAVEVAVTAPQPVVTPVYKKPEPVSIEPIAPLAASTPTRTVVSIPEEMPTGISADEIAIAPISEPAPVVTPVEVPTPQPTAVESFPAAELKPVALDPTPISEPVAAPYSKPANIGRTDFAMPTNPRQHPKGFVDPLAGYVTGWVEYIGYGARRPAAFRLVKGGEILFLVRSSKYNLRDYVNQRIAVDGTVELAPGWSANVLVVDRLRLMDKGPIAEVSQERLPAVLPAPPADVEDLKPVSAAPVAVETPEESVTSDDYVPVLIK